MKIGGSNAAGICGISPWSTPLEEFLKITGKLKTPDNPAMYWGRKLEPLVRERYEEETGRQVIHNTDPGKYGLEYRYPPIPFIVGSLDGVSLKDGTEPRVLEIKTARSRDGWEDGVPEYYQCQVAHYLACTGFERADVAVLFGASDFEIFELERDQELIDLVIGAEVKFWNEHIMTGNPPEPTNLNDVAIRWPMSRSVQVEANANIIEALEELKALRVQLAGLDTKKAALELQIKSAMQDADTLLIGGKPAATWKLAKASMVFDKETFEKEHSELLKQYMKERPGSRRFLIK